MSLTDNQLMTGAPASIISLAENSIGGSFTGGACLFTATQVEEQSTFQAKNDSHVPTTGDLFGHAAAIEADGNNIVGMPCQNVTNSSGI